MTPQAQPKSVRTPPFDISQGSDQELKDLSQFGSSQEPNVSNRSPQNRYKNVQNRGEKGGLGRPSK